MFESLIAAECLAQSPLFLLLRLLQHPRLLVSAKTPSFTGSFAHG
jgi:hypothetical protein